jgi:hypothetical protein
MFQLSFGNVATLAGVFQRNAREGADGKFSLLAREPVGEIP